MKICLLIFSLLLLHIHGKYFVDLSIALSVLFSQSVSSFERVQVYSTN